MPETNCILVTGGAGFIGSHLIRHLLANCSSEVVNVDKLSYASNLDSLNDVSENPKYAFERVDLVDADAVESVFQSHRPDAVYTWLPKRTSIDRSARPLNSFTQMLSGHSIC